MTPNRAEGVDRVLLLAPGPHNPRNSEGAFLSLADGSLLFVYTHFTGGRSDHAEAHLAARRSLDAGRTWSDGDSLVLPNEGGMNIMSVSLLRLQDGRIALFYLCKNSDEDCRPVLRLSADEARTWSRPIPVVPDANRGYFVLNNDRAVQLSGGRLVLPVALHNRPGWPARDWAGEILCFLSDDGGATWRPSRDWRKAYAADGTRVTAQEPGVVERLDGSLLLMARTNAGVQYVSVSSDQGESWSPLTPSDIHSPLSPASIKRIPASGNLLLVWNDHRSIADGLRGRRTPLTAAISKDDGRTWGNPVVIESDPEGWYCYTAIAFVPDHVLLAYCTGNRAQSLAATQVTRLPLTLFG